MRPHKALHHLSIALFLIAACARISCAAATFDQVKAAYRPSDTSILASNGEVIQRVRTDASVRRGQWVALADVSPALRTALVLSEDKRFYEHSGVDWRAVSSAAWGNLWATKTRGASTISMQLAGLMDEDLRAGNGGRSISQKISQTVATQVLASWAGWSGHRCCPSGRKSGHAANRRWQAAAPRARTRCRSFPQQEG